MKTKQYILLILGLLLANISHAQEQTEPLPKVGFGSFIGHLSLGNGIAGGAGAGLLDTVYTQTKVNSPVLTLGADYTPQERFSVGLMAGYQRINVSLDDSIGTFREEANINRLYFGFRGLWHFGKSEKVDLYSGFKVGAVMFSTGTISGPDANNSFLESENNRTRYSLGIIPLGARFIITPELGAHAQMSIGAPTFLSAGINYRIR